MSLILPVMGTVEGSSVQPPVFIANFNMFVYKTVDEFFPDVNRTTIFLSSKSKVHNVDK